MTVVVDIEEHPAEDSTNKSDMVQPKSLDTSRGCQIRFHDVEVYVPEGEGTKKVIHGICGEVCVACMETRFAVVLTACRFTFVSCPNRPDPAKSSPSWVLPVRNTFERSVGSFISARSITKCSDPHT